MLHYHQHSVAHGTGRPPHFHSFTNRRHRPTQKNKGCMIHFPVQSSSYLHQENPPLFPVAYIFGRTLHFKILSPPPPCLPFSVSTSFKMSQQWSQVMLTPARNARLFFSFLFFWLGLGLLFTQWLISAQHLTAQWPCPINTRLTFFFYVKRPITGQNLQVQTSTYFCI